eukprot:5840607-Prymnesium_polylepis.1
MSASQNFTQNAENKRATAAQDAHVRHDVKADARTASVSVRALTLRTSTSAIRLTELTLKRMGALSSNA